MKLAPSSAQLLPAVSACGTCQPPVHFEFHDGTARSVCLAGSFNDWSAAATPMGQVAPGRWVLDLVLPVGVYEYRIVVDGRWVTDPNSACRVPNPFGESNSRLVVTAPDRPPSPRRRRRPQTA